MIYFIKVILVIFGIYKLYKIATENNTQKAYEHLYDLTIMAIIIFLVEPIA